MFVQDGVTTLEITLGNVLLLSFDVYDYEGMACADVLVIASSYGTDDWQATYEGILDGSNYYDVMFGVNTASMDDYAYAQLYAVEGGQTVSATLEAVTENADTDEQVITTMLSLDMAQGEQTINLGGMAAETVLVDDQGMPSVDDKYVLDVMALPIDMLMNGLPQFFENIVVAMPEAVQLVIDALAQVEGLEFLEGITVIEEEEMTATESLDEIAEEVMPETTTEVVSEENTAVTTVTTIIPDDEIAPHEAPKMDGMIEDM